MKKLFSIVLAVVMVLSVASMAMAFTWGQAAESDTPFGYTIEVIKYTRQTGAIGSSNFIADKYAAAVNNADVYFAIKLVVPDIAKTKDIRAQAKVKISITALEKNVVASQPEVNISELDPGTYYYTGTAAKNGTALELAKAFVTIPTFGTAGYPASPVFSADCLDTETAKVYAKVYTGRALGTEFQTGSYYVVASGSEVVFSDTKGGTGTKNANAVTFTRDADSGKVSAVKADATNTDAQYVVKLYNYLGITAADVADGKVYMSDDNLKAAFGFAYSDASEATWKASSTPIILDPTVAIPKTGDNASVIGFAMIMVAIVAAAVAVKKVNA